MDPLQIAAIRRAQAALTIATHDGRADLARTYLRWLIVNEIGKGQANYAQNRWGSDVAREITKATVGAIDTVDLGDAAQAFFASVMEASLLGRIQGLRRVVFGARMIAPTSGLAGHWVAEGKATPLSRLAIAGSTLRPLRVSAIACVTRESLERPGEVAEALLQTDLERAVTGPLDWAFIDPSNAGSTDEIPASVAYGQTQIPSVGPDADSIREDFAALFAAFEGDFSSAVLVLHPTTAAQIALLQKPLGETSLTVNGGVLFGVPAVTSRSVPITSVGTSITLLDASAIAYDATGLSITPAGHATLEMSDVPTNDSTTPTATQVVNLWQTNTVAWRADIQANWKVHGSGRVVSLTGVDYSGGQS